MTRTETEEGAWLRVGLAVCLLVSTASVAGCLNSFEDPDRTPQPLNVTGILVEQEQRSGPSSGYMGSIRFPYCASNPNNFDIRVQLGFEVYQVRGPQEDPELHIVERGGEGPFWLYEDYETGGGPGYIHHVLYNETMEGNSTDYAIHLWHEILDPDPIHRWDRWFNVTFTPFMEETFHEEGKSCWVG